MKQIIDYLWNASPFDAALSITIAVCWITWLISVIRPSSDH